MAGVATKKPGADTGVALTFPAVYSDVYAADGRGERFATEPPLPRTDEMPGGLDLQDDYHQQKYLDARAMAFAALAARKSADKRMMLSHANYFGMPAPVLGQRRFANPSLGNQSGAIDSARRTVADDGVPFHCAMDAVAGSGLSGGVLRSAAGQRYGRSLLQRRVKQLDAIDAADATFSETTPVAPLSDAYPIRAQLELSTAMDRLATALEGDAATATRFIVEDFGKVVRDIARFSVSSDREGLEDAIVTVETSLAQARAREGRVGGDVVSIRLQALATYLRGMLQNINLSTKDKKSLSANLLRSTGLTRITTIGREVFAARERRAARVAARRGRVAAEFAVPARPREDAEAEEVDEGFGAGAGARRRFDRDQRQVFGERAGAFFGEAAPAEAAAARAAAPMRARPEPAAPAAAAAAAAVPPPPAGRGRGRGRASNPMRKDRSNRMSVAAATREAPEPAFASLRGLRRR